VRTVLRLLADHRAAEQFDAVIRPEDLGLDQPLVFHTRPLPQLHVHRSERTACPTVREMYLPTHAPSLARSGGFRVIRGGETAATLAAKLE